MHWFGGGKGEVGRLALAPPLSTGPQDITRARIAKRLALLAIASRSCGALAPPQQSKRYMLKAKRLALLASRVPKELSGLSLLSWVRRLALPPLRPRCLRC